MAEHALVGVHPGHVLQLRHDLDGEHHRSGELSCDGDSIFVKRLDAGEPGGPSTCHATTYQETTTRPEA